MQAVVPTLPAAVHTLGAYRLAEALHGEAAELLGTVDAVRTVPARHIRARRLVHADRLHAGDLFHQIPEVVHCSADLGAALVVILELHACQGGAELIGSSLHTAEREHRKGRKLGAFLNIIGVISLVMRKGDGSFVVFSVIGHEHTELTCGEGLHTHHTHRRDIAE